MWCPALDADGEPRDNGEVADLSGLYRTHPAGDQLEDWPTDMRIIAWRERPHPGAQLSLFEQHEGFRFQLTATSLPHRNIQLVEACHRVQARVESRIRCGEATGLRRMPSKSFALNSAWCAAVALACDLLAWLALLALDGDLAKAEPKTVRYRLLHTAGRIVHGQRKRRLRLPENWPWTQALHTAFTWIFALPAPPDTRPRDPTRRKGPARPVEPAPTRGDTQDIIMPEPLKPTSTMPNRTIRAVNDHGVNFRG